MSSSFARAITVCDDSNDALTVFVCQMFLPLTFYSTIVNSHGILKAINVLQDESFHFLL